jgi:hypothetical protein
VFLDCGIQALKQNQEVHGIHEEVQHAIALRMDEGEALRAHQFLRLLAKDSGSNVSTLVAHGYHIDLRRCVVPPIAIEVTLPEALHAKVVEAIVAREGCWVVTALFASLLRLDDVPIGDIHEHRLVLQTVTSAVHVLEALEAEVIFAICTENLRSFHSARGAKTAASRRERGVVLARPLTLFVQCVETRLAERHKALVAFQCGLHNSTRLARDLQVAEALVEKHVRLREEQPVHGRLRSQHQKIQSLPLQDLKVTLRERVLYCIIIIHRVVEVHNACLAYAHLRIWRHGRGQHLASDPRELWLDVNVNA